MYYCKMYRTKYMIIGLYLPRTLDIRLGIHIYKDNVSINKGNIYLLINFIFGYIQIGKYNEKHTKI